MYQGENFEAFLHLKDSLGAPVEGLTYQNLIVRTWNTKQTAMQPLTLVNGDLVDMGGGLYVLKLAKEIYPNTGMFYLEVKGATFVEFNQQYPVDAKPISTLQSPAVCVVSGNIMEITGTPTHSREEISFRMAKAPASVGGALMSAERIVLYPDAYGNFSIQLVRYAEIAVEIKRAGINFKFTVPNLATAPLLSLIPNV